MPSHSYVLLQCYAVSPCLDYLEYLRILSKLFCPFYRSFMNLLKSTSLCGIQLVTSLHCEKGTLILTLYCLSFYWLFIHVKTCLLSQSNLAALLRDIVESLLEFHGNHINGISLQRLLLNSRAWSWEAGLCFSKAYAIHTHMSSN